MDTDRAFDELAIAAWLLAIALTCAVLARFKRHEI